MEAPQPSTNPLAGSQRAAAIAGAVSSVFGAVLIVWGVSLHSVAMTAGGILTATRGVMAVFILAGIRLSRRHTSTFSYGLYKLENVIAAVVGVIVLIVTYELAKVSITHLNRTGNLSSRLCRTWSRSRSSSSRMRRTSSASRCRSKPMAPLSLPT